MRRGVMSGRYQSVQKCLAKWRLVTWPTLVARIRTRFYVSLQQSTSYARANMVYFAILELTGQPLYYYIWSDVYPQAYESLWLRAICMLLALPMLFEPQFSRKRYFERWVAAYWLFSLWFQLPFFFFLMTLLNNLSAVWDLSGLAALMLLVILAFDWVMTVLLAAAGALLAWAAFVALGGSLSAGHEVPLPVLFSIYLFGVVVGSAVNYKSELIAREKLAAITDALGTMAHELRTPLLGIRSGANGLSTYLPALIDGYDMAQKHGLQVKPIRKAHFRQMQSVLKRIYAESEYSAAMIDMLLVNSDRASIDRSLFEPVRIDRKSVV